MPGSYQYGGQAVIEGVMMRGPSSVAVAVRAPGGDVIIDKKEITSVGEKYPVLKKPVFRGVVALVESMVLGIKTLTFSANVAVEEEDEELSFMEIAASIGLAVLLAVLLFIVVPTVAAHFMSGFLSPFFQNLFEGALRIFIFLGYVAGISLIKDIRRVFEYHGAEHKVIHAFEAGDDLSDIDAIQRHSTLHPRCGTAFLLIVMVLTVFFFSFLGEQGIAWRIVSRILLLPLIAGVAYEFIKFTSKNSGSPFVKALIAPGLWLQKMTTREPDDSQVEVAVRALRAVVEEESETGEETVSEQGL